MKPMSDIRQILAVSESKVKFLEEVSKEELLESSIYEYELLVDKDN